MRPKTLILLFVAGLVVSRTASADPKVEGRARALQRKAIEEDSLNVAYPAAIRRLTAALKLCKPKACPPKLRGELLRDLGAMRVLGGSTQEGRKDFERARALDAGLSLDPNNSTPAVEKVWSDVKGENAAATGSGPPVEAGPPVPANPPERAEPQPEEPPATAPPRERRFWVGVWGSLDFAIMPSADQACRLAPSAAPVNTVGYYCTDTRGNDFPARNDGGAQNALIDPNPQNGDAVNGGAVVGDVRLGLSFDYALGENFLLGVRAGIVLRSYPGKVAPEYGNGVVVPIHVEARVTYLIGAQALHARLAPLVFLDGGVAETDGALPLQVLLDNNPNGAGQHVSANAWAVGGPAFAGAGVGLRALLNPRLALTVAGKFALTLGAPTPPLPTFGPELSLAYAL